MGGGEAVVGLDCWVGFGIVELVGCWKVGAWGCIIGIVSVGGGAVGSVGVVVGLCGCGGVMCAFTSVGVVDGGGGGLFSITHVSMIIIIISSRVTVATSGIAGTSTAIGQETGGFTGCLFHVVIASLQE